jgi:hypothetical protein
VSNQIVNLAANQGSPAITIVDSASSLQVLQRLLSAILFGATATFVDLSFQTINGTATINLPTTNVFFVYIRNLDTTGDFTVNYTPVVGTPGTVVLQRGASDGQGGVLLYFNPSAAGAGGLSALSITAAAVLKAEVIVAG